MLAVQVQYWDLQERKRHNVVSEKQNARNLQIAEGELEVHRGQLAESVRSHQAQEQIGWANLEENKRHNVSVEYTNLMNADTNRMNAETNRMYVPIQWFNAETSRMSAESQVAYNSQMADINQQNADTRYKEYVTTASNKATELAIQSESLENQKLNTGANWYNAMTNRAAQKSKSEYLEQQTNVNWANVDIAQHHLNLDRIDTGRKVFDTFSNNFMNAWRNLNESAKIFKDH